MVLFRITDSLVYYQFRPDPSLNWKFKKTFEEAHYSFEMCPLPVIDLSVHLQWFLVMQEIVDKIWKYGQNLCIESQRCEYSKYIPTLEFIKNAS